MDERAWRAGRQLHELYEVAAPRLSERKLRLFAVACCRRIPMSAYGTRGARALEVADRCAEGLASEDERALAEQEAFEAHAEVRDRQVVPPAGEPAWTRAAEMASRALSLVVAVGPFHALDAAEFARRATVPPRVGHPYVYEAREEEWQCVLLREIAGPLPFRQVAVKEEWRAANDGAALRLAEEAHAGAWELVPIVADALEEAGCADQELLDHLRLPGDHVPGCWALDLALGRE